MFESRERRSLSFRGTGTALFVCACSLIAAANSQDRVQAFTEPYRDIDLAAGEMGTLESVHVKEGDRVVAGQLLAALNCDDLIAAPEISYAAAEAEGRLFSALAELRLQADRVLRLEGLRHRNHASQQEVDRAVMQKEVAEAQVQMAREEILQRRLAVERIKA